MNATRRKKDDEIARLQREVAEKDRFITGQSQRIAASQERAARLRIERDEAQALAQRNAGIDPDEVAQTRAYLEEGRAAYRQLREEFDQVAEALRSATEDRKTLHPVIADWDRLCRMLHEATSGRPKATRDQETLSTWQRIRPLLSGKTTPTQPTAK